MGSANPWVTTTQPARPDVATGLELEFDVDEVEVWTGARFPQPGVPAPDQADRLGRVTVPAGETLWVVGAHGGAGESVLAGWLGGKATHHRWPVLVDDTRARTLLVARTSAAGLAAARVAATDWASGGTPVDLVGLVLVADAPGRLPRQLLAEAKHLAGGLPHTWQMPYVPALRLAHDPSRTDPPGAARRVVRAITTHTPRRSTP